MLGRLTGPVAPQQRLARPAGRQLLLASCPQQQRFQRLRRARTITAVAAPARRPADARCAAAAEQQRRHRCRYGAQPRTTASNVSACVALRAPLCLRCSAVSADTQASVLEQPPASEASPLVAAAAAAVQELDAAGGGSAPAGVSVADEEVASRSASSSGSSSPCEDEDEGDCPVFVDRDGNILQVRRMIRQRGGTAMQGVVCLASQQLGWAGMCDDSAGQQCNERHQPAGAVQHA